ncbi:hypothetical protein EJF36_08545 [Bacillus sp. HMF5848]|uniref:hypothetical protein n=1 Tax=Bacillus sp. HMF5848 TaxID=2495421 RepID=UPI000F77D8B5|nr:hypothetical protein [Bacillus sp. HMF5848]RSK26913.1 hypothetical protein EJF36_08545 [Bacillus sp. HMF5848]
MKKLLIILNTVYMLVGCQQDKPEPQSLIIQPVEIINHSVDVIPVTAKSTGKEKRSMTIRHHVNNNDVYVECIVTDFSFQKDKQNNVEGEGHLVLYLNDQKLDTIKTAAFIIKGLPKGTHKIRVELVHNNNNEYGLQKEFTVTIPAEG